MDRSPTDACELSEVLGKRLFNSYTQRGKITLVTGATSGIGRASCIRMAKESAIVIVTGLPRNEKKGLEVVSEIIDAGGTALWYPLDVTKEKDWECVITKIESDYGSLDIVVNNAGIISQSANCNIEDLSLGEWEKMMSVNLTGTFLGCKWAIGLMKKTQSKESRSIINVSSVAGIIGSGWIIDYCSSKAGVRVRRLFQ